MKIYRMTYRMRIFKCPQCKEHVELPSVKNHSLDGIVCKLDKTPLSEMKLISDQFYRVRKEVTPFSEKTADESFEA
jgi:hypothetical protein